MPNRILKESICTSEEIDRLSLFHEVFFYRLMVNCDDYGRMDARPRVLASRLFPLKDMQPEDVVSALLALRDDGLIILYEAEGKPYLQMKTWERHQQVRNHKSKYPSPDEDTCNQLKSIDINCNQLQSIDSNCPRNPIQSNTNPNPNPNPKENPNPKQNPTRARAMDTLTSEMFDSFWELYPNKVAKQDALKAWKKIWSNKPDKQDLMPMIMDGLKRWLASDEWNREDGRFIPYPATWLNGRRWEDEVRPRKTDSSPVKRVIAQDFEQRSYEQVDDDGMAKLAREIEEMKRREEGCGR